ncbi:MAG: hypothetical protein ACJAWV_000247 [Flammeovirgaceae bacterium]|jgi:hypothetical protein
MQNTFSKVDKTLFLVILFLIINTVATKYININSALAYILGFCYACFPLFLARSIQNKQLRFFCILLATLYAGYMIASRLKDYIYI